LDGTRVGGELNFDVLRRMAHGPVITHGFLVKIVNHPLAVPPVEGVWGLTSRRDGRPRANHQRWWANTRGVLIC
jgi:hypothetical protein